MRIKRATAALGNKIIFVFEQDDNTGISTDMTAKLLFFHVPLHMLHAVAHTNTACAPDVNNKQLGYIHAIR